MRTVVEHLAERARTHPTQVALHIPIGSVNRTGPTPHRAVTFAELGADSDALAAGMLSAGIAAEIRVAVMVPPGLDFFSLTFALFKIGAVPVLIDPGMGIRNLGKCLAQAEPGAFVGVPKAHLARRLFGWAKRSVRVTVNVGGRRFFCTRSTGEMRRDRSSLEFNLQVVPRRAESARPDAQPGSPSGLADSARPDPHAGNNLKVELQQGTESLAAILFTSGSTGLAKGVEYTHAIFAAQLELLKRTYGIEPGEIDFCAFPLFALFGAALGMTSVVPDMDATRPATIDPAKVRSQLRQFRCTNLFGSPAVLKRLANERDADVNDYASLRRVLSAGAPATPAVLESFTKLLPAGVPIFTPYGATECLPVANISSAEILNETRALTEQGRGVCVGRPVDGMEVVVIPITDGAIPASRPCQRSGESPKSSDPAVEIAPSLPGHPTVDMVGSPFPIGEFVVRGPVVTPRYFNTPEATALAKIRDPITGEILHRMGDVGYIDERGRLWFCGRKSQRVETPQGTLFTDMVEPVFNTVEGVVRTALVGVISYDDATTLPVLCVEVRRRLGNRKWRELTDRLRQKADLDPLMASIELFLQYRGSFPVDVRHNSKIFREKLSDWANMIYCTGYYPEFKL